MFEKVNKELLPIKGHYFLYNAATGPIVPFLPTIAKQLGFSGTLVGSIYTILPISGLIAKPLFGGLADKFKLHKTFFLLFQAVLAVGFFGINFISPIETSAEVTLACDGGITVMEIPMTDNKINSKILNDLNRASLIEVDCQLTCDASNRAYEELCKNWQAVQFCNLRNRTVDKKDKFSFLGGLNTSSFDQERSIAYLRIRNATFLDNVAHSPACEFQLRTNCVTTCPDSVSVSELLEVSEGRLNPAQSSTYQFHLFLWFAIVSWIGMAVVVSIGDAICFGLLGEDNGRSYGKQKMWGSIGFGIFGISAGYLVDLFSFGETNKNYTVIFYLMLFAMVLDILVSSRLKKEKVDREPSVLWELWNVGKEGRVLAFGWWCIGAGICTGVVWNFLFWYTEEIATGSQKNWIKTLQGLLTGVQCFAGEMPFNFLSGSLLRRLGHVNVMSLVLLTYAIRFMAYSLTTNPWVFLPLEILHGPSLGLCWPTMVSYGGKVAPSGTKATMQGLVGGIFEGIGVSLGSFICGLLMDRYGGVITFRAFSAGALIWLAIHWVLQLLLIKSKSNLIHQGHNHLATYAAPQDAIYMTTSQELQTY